MTDTEVKNAKYNERDKAKDKLKRNKRSDGGGLYLELTSTGSKLWRMNYRFEGKQRTLYMISKITCRDLDGQTQIERHILRLKHLKIMPHATERIEISLHLFEKLRIRSVGA